MLIKAKHSIIIMSLIKCREGFMTVELKTVIINCDDIAELDHIIKELYAVLCIR